VVLAAGRGTRLTALTRALYGHDLPKQYAVLAGERSLLQSTLDRLAPLVPASRTVVVVAESHADVARAQLAGYRGVEIVAQPCNLDTGPGVLLPLAHVLARDPYARVVVAPADHHVPNPRPMLAALAATAVDTAVRDRVTLLGAVPDADELDLGWIVRGGRLSNPPSRTPAWQVAELHDRPRRDAAAALRAEGALWSTLVLAGAARTLWETARAHLPAHVEAFDRYRASIGRGFEATARARAYIGMAPASFGRDVLAHTTGLATIAVAGTGWSDWGAPERVLHSLRGSADLAPLLRRLAGWPLAAAG
jgi:mannose-1-phosphate guanylyltransferase